MNIFNLGFLLSCVVTAYFLGSFGNRMYGPYVGAAGVVVGFLLPYAAMLAIRRVNGFLLKRRPPRPVCESGKCKWDDYRLVEYDHGELEFMCLCGRRYVKSGNRFLKLSKDGHTEPYKVRVRGRWVDDKGSQ